MVKLNKNTCKHTIVIPTAGLGTRLGELGKKINKSLLPFFDKPLLSHIINRCPKDSKIIIPVGYKSQQVKDLIELVHSDKNIITVDIDDYTSEKSGTAYSFKKCLEYIDGPFWYIPCDTYFDENIFDVDLNDDFIFVKKVDKLLHNQYTTFLIENNKIQSIEFKKETSENYVAFTGVMYIQNYKKFNSHIQTNNSNEIIDSIELNSSVSNLNSWIDLGNIQYYKEQLLKIQKYDFSKTNEFIYIVDNKVIKWFDDQTIAEKKFKKISQKLNLVPNNCMYKNNFFIYDFAQGNTLYEYHDKELLVKLLNWFDGEMWNIDTTRDIRKSCELFYKNKTITRIDNFLQKYPSIESVGKINNTDVKEWKYYFDNIDWNLLITDTLPSFIHGDLQFDNLLYDKNRDQFKIIDWRHEFADLIEIGDVYYDLSKLIGGFILNYKKIKQNIFSINIHKDEVTIDIPSIDNVALYIDIVKTFINQHNWNLQKVELLIPIIFWNMAPLHTYPFDKFLWFLGIKLFEDYEKNYKSK